MSKPHIPTNEALINGLVHGGMPAETLVAHITTPSLVEQRGESRAQTPDPLTIRLGLPGDGAPIERHEWDLDKNGELILD